MQVHRSSLLRHPYTDFVPAPVALGILRSEQLHSVQRLMYVAHKMEEPRNGNGFSLWVVILHHPLIISPPRRLHKTAPCRGQRWERLEAYPAIGSCTRDVSLQHYFYVLDTLGAL